MKTPHTAAHAGKRVRLKLKSGERIDDRFVTRTDHWVVLENYGRIMKRDIKAFFVLKEKS